MTRRGSDKKTKEAVAEFTSRLHAAMRAFRASNDPMWRRTWDGMSCFARLPMANMPPALEEDIYRRLSSINKITARYPIQTEEDYRHISEKDLAAIQDLIVGFAFDKN
jgi:hypothetical protein